MDLIRALLSLWASVWSFVVTCWRRVIYGTKNTDIELATDRFPPPPKATKEAADAFVQSLLPSAVKALASRYNNGKDCELIGRLHGSFNVCFFVKFRECGTEWIIRIPIEPRLHRPWHKLQSEVATLEYEIPATIKLILTIFQLYSLPHNYSSSYSSCIWPKCCAGWR